MTRFAWLQTRTQTLVTAGLLAALAVAAAITGVQLSHLFHRLVANCTSGCGFAIDEFGHHQVFMDRLLDILARAVPALLGLFWGAPLVARELETGTYRLAWTQSVSRSRWLLVKLAVGGLFTMLVAGILTLTVTWWSRAPDSLGGSSPFDVFDRRDVVPIAYAAFAFALGALLGAVLRRVVPAMAATLAGFALVRVGVALWVRPHLESPIQKTLSLKDAGPSSPVHLGIGISDGGPLQLFAQGGGPPRSWNLSSQLLSTAGDRVSSSQVAAFLHDSCPNVLPPAARPLVGGAVTKVPGGADDPARACLQKAAQTYHVLVTYQPAGRYWAFQWLEAGIFVLLAIAAASACFWWVTRRAQ